MSGWILEAKLAWSLRMPMSLHNSDAKIKLFGPGNQPRDKFSYMGRQPGVIIQTKH